MSEKNGTKPKSKKKAKRPPPEKHRAAVPRIATWRVNYPELHRLQQEWWDRPEPVSPIELSERTRDIARNLGYSEWPGINARTFYRWLTEKGERLDGPQLAWGAMIMGAKRLEDIITLEWNVDFEENPLLKRKTEETA